MATEILIAFDEFYDDAEGFLKYDRGEVLQVLEHVSQSSTNTKRYNGETGLIYKECFDAFDLKYAFKLHELDTYSKHLQYFLNGSFLIAKDGQGPRMTIAYNAYGSVKTVDISGLSSENIVQYIVDNHDILHYYLDHTSITYADKRLNNFQVIHTRKDNLTSRNRSDISQSELNRRFAAHTTIVEPYIPEWFHGYMSRDTCESILSKKNAGSFLVRRRKVDGICVLSVVVNERPASYTHVLLIPQFDGIFFKNAHVTSVLDLVQANIGKPFSTYGDANMPMHDLVVLNHPVYRPECIVPAEVESFDPSVIDRYIHALESGVETPNTVRVMVIGHFGVGKSSLTKALIVDSEKEISSTNGIDVHDCCVSENGTWTKNCMDNQRSSIKRIARASQTSEGAGTAGVHVSPVQESDASDSPFEKCFKDDGTDSSRTGSKQDKTQINIKAEVHVDDTEVELIYSRRSIHDINEDDLKAFASACIADNPYANVEPKPDFNIKLWDFGGQYIYYATHQIFHSSAAVYLLVLDMSKELTDIVDDEEIPKGSNEIQTQDVQTYCKFWMNSIHSFVGTQDGEPPVILIGTHVDKVDGDPETIGEAYFENVRKLFSKSPLLKHIQPEEFVVNNLQPDEEKLSALRGTIFKVAQRQKSWNKSLPAKWIPLENRLIAKRKERVIPFEDICSIDREAEVPVGEEDDIRLFLAYHSSIGTFIYFNEKGLSDFVVIDPQWIVDAFRCVITARRFRREAENRRLWEDLVDNAVLRQELLDHVWRDEMFNSHRDILVGYLQKLGIVARARQYNEVYETVEDLDFFVVPSLLKQNNKDEVQQFCCDRKSTSVTLVFQFENSFVPPVLFHRTVAAVMGRWPVLTFDEKNMLFADAGIFRLDRKHAGIIAMTDVSLELRVVGLCADTVDPDQSDRLRRFVEMVLGQELDRNQPNKNNLYSVHIRCHEGTKCGKTTVSKESIEGQINIPCPDLASNHDIDVRQLMIEWFPDAETSVKTVHEIIGNQSVDPEVSITQQEMNRIANSLGHNWELLILSLDVPEVKIDQIKMDHPFSCSLQIFHCLMEWKKRNGSLATLQKLIGKISEQENLNVSWDKIKNMVNEFPC